jgi:hypothetical protein
MSDFKLPTQKCALIKAMLDGHTLDIINGMKIVGCTNTSREIGRYIIHPVTGFGAKVIKKQINITTQYGTKGYYFSYKLDKSDENKEAIERMRKYLSEQEIKPKANNEKKMLYSEQTLF